MFKKMSPTLLAGVSLLAVGFHQAAAVEAAQTQYSQPTVIYAGQPAPQPNTSMRVASAERSNMGGGFIEFLFGDVPSQGGRYQQPPVYQQQPAYQQPQPAYQPPPSYEPQQSLLPQAVPQQGLQQQGMPQQEEASDPTQRPFDPRFEKQLVEYHGKENAGTIVVDTPNKFLFLVQGNGKALRYGIGVGKPGFTWSGIKQITAKKEWPDWTPPAEMLQRRPDLPRHMEGGPQNPLGARAMYLGSTLYRIHGSNEPWTIGTNVSSGCIRMRNQDVIDLYGRVTVGARVIVI